MMLNPRHRLIWKGVTRRNKEGASREYWMIYRTPGFLTFLWFGTSPTPSPPSPAIKLSLLLSFPVCCRSSLLLGGGRGGWGWSRTIRWRESLTLSKLFNTLWLYIAQNRFAANISENEAIVNPLSLLRELLQQKAALEASFSSQSLYPFK